MRKPNTCFGVDENSILCLNDLVTDGWDIQMAS